MRLSKNRKRLVKLALRANAVRCFRFNLQKENGNNCIICSNNDSTPSKASPGVGTLKVLPIPLFPDHLLASVHQPTTLIQNVGVVQLLKKALKLSSVELNTFMKDSGGLEPKDWIPLCSKCTFQVNQIGVLCEEINRLQEIIENCTVVILDTWKQSEDQEKGVDVEGTEDFMSMMEKRKARVHERIMRKNPNKRAAQSKCKRSCTPEQMNSGSIGGNERDSEMAVLEEEWMDNVSDTMSLEDPLDIKPFTETEMLLIEENENMESSLAKPSSSKKKVTKNSKKDPKVDKVIEDVIGPGPSRKDCKHLTHNYPCSSCPELDPMDLDKMIVHIMFHRNRPNRCTECSAYLPLEEDLIEGHWEKFHSGVVPPPNTPKFMEIEAIPVGCWECGKPNCSKQFMSCSERDKHEKDKHGLVVETPETCVAGECSMKFRSIQEVRLHVALEHPEFASMCCCYCEKSLAVDAKEPGFKYRDPDLLHSHIMSEHPEHTKKVRMKITDELHTIPQFLQDCPVCGYVYKFARESILMDEHIKECHGMSRSFRCHICSRDMTYKVYWSHYQRYHTSPVVCDSCGELVPVTQLALHLLKKHGVIMEGHEQYLQRCPEKDCEYVTFVRYYFREHLLTHKEDRPYKCQFCQKAFKFSSHRGEHEMIHKNKESKPYQCEICGNSFALKNYLYIHKRLSHLGKKFPSTNRKRSAIPGARNNRRKQTASAPTPTTASEPNPGTNPDPVPAFPPGQTEIVYGEAEERTDTTQQHGNYNIQNPELQESMYMQYDGAK